MADYPYSVWGMKAIYGASTRALPVPSPQHGIALSGLPAQRQWLAGELDRIGATSVIGITFRTVDRGKPVRR